MTMSDQWTDRLSEYVDGALAPAERSALEQHVATCAACRETADELRRVVARARALEDRPPTADLWPGIATRIGATRRRAFPRLSFSVPQLLAASVVLMLASGGGVWLALRSRGPTPTPGSEPGPTVSPVAWVSRTDRTIADLERALEQGQGRLDTATVRVVRENLAIIDVAIAQARRALQADPGNAYLNLHLADTMRRKVELLRRVNAIAAAQS
jgi:hypothetical protein